MEEPADDRCKARAKLALPGEHALATLARTEHALPDEHALARAEPALPDEHALARAEPALPNEHAPQRDALALPNEHAPATPARLTPLRFKVQFTASEEYVELVEKANALLLHSAPRAGLDEIHLRAMRALVAELERYRYAVTARPQQRARTTSTPAPPTPEAHQAREQVGKGRSNPKCESASALESESESAEPEPEPEPVHPAEHGDPRRRGRYVPAAVRRAVFARDQARCTYTSGSEQRCRETSGLELHHSRAFARGGEHTEENLTLRCRAHNDFAAERDFGRDYIEFARDSTEHEPWATHEAARGDARAGLR